MEVSRVPCVGSKDLDNIYVALEQVGVEALGPKPSTLNFKPSTPNPKPSTLNPQPSTLNPQPSTQIPKP